MKTLLLGYGNLDRQDDGVAWHVLAGLHRLLGRPAPAEPEEGFDCDGCDPAIEYALQLTPEMAEMVADFDNACFIDAHTGEITDDIRVSRLEVIFQQSPFTHHMTPETLLSFCETLYQHSPKAILVSIRGYEFGFSRQLSPRTLELADQAVQEIWSWLQTGFDDEQDNPPDH